MRGERSGRRGDSVVKAMAAGQEQAKSEAPPTWQALADLLKLPEGAKPLAVLCLGPVKEFYPAPMLVLEGWAQARPRNELLYENYWGVNQ